MRNRVFRFLVCVALICCILVNCSPIRVHASAVIAGAAITGTGVFATLFSMAMGVVFVDLTADLINGLGKSFKDHVTSKVGTDESEILKVWIEPLQVDLDSGGISQLPPDQDDDTNTWATLAGLFSIPEELLDNFLDWGKSLINSGGVEVDNPEANDVWCTSISREYYDGINTYSSSEPFGAVYFTYDTSVSWTFGELLLYNYSGAPISFNNGSIDGSASLSSYNGLFYALSNGDAEDFVVHGSYWDLGYLGKFSSNSAARSAVLSLILATSSTVFIEPDTYVGDIPQQVQDDTFEEEKYELPYINYTQLFQNQTDAIDALNNVATQLQNQNMTYEEYMEQVNTPSSSGGSDIGSGGDDSGSDDSGGSSSNPTYDKVPSITPFGLNLKNFFPFCIPFDIYDMFSALSAEPQTPKFEWAISLPNGTTYEIVVDLSPWDGFAATFRTMQLLLFIVGLAGASRKFIKW